MKIENLLEKYFEGETSAAEEKELRQFFSSGVVPEELKVYQPLFAYFEEEIGQLIPTTPVVKRSSRVSLYAFFSAVAASLLMLLAIHLFSRSEADCICAGNYVMINGQCYTDPEQVRSLALKALQEVATPAEAYFPAEEEADFGKKIIEEQLREFGSLFSDDD